MALSTKQAQRFYNRVGRKQDTQAFYEDPALDDLIAHGAFEAAQSVCEFGCGTGRFAARLLHKVLPKSATYTGVDVSDTMVGVARERLTEFGARASIVQSDGAMHIALPDHTLERFVSTYVLDLLAPPDIAALLAETHRVLKPDGRLCLVSLSRGVTLWSKMLIAAWKTLYALRPILTGGCRPLDLTAYLDQSQWRVAHHRVIVRFGVPSEVVVALPVQRSAAAIQRES